MGGVLLFVYGTLMREYGGAPGWRTRTRARYMGRGRAHGSLFDMGAYPGAVFAAHSGSQVHGEVYAISKPEALANLDGYEGDGFARRRVQVELESGRRVWAWAYALKRPGPMFRRIDSGDYRAG